MGYLAKYEKTDFKRLSWEEYGRTLNILYRKLNKYLRDKRIKIDAVVPILRGGAFPGTYLAFQLNLLRILPVQYKYFFEHKTIKLKRILSLPRSALPRNPVFLLVEQNHCFGQTASVAARDLKKRFPRCRIIYAVDHMDYSYQEVAWAEKGFYGKLTNETRALKTKDCKKKKISPFSYLFPWENLEEEWITVQGKQFRYRDTKAVSKLSKIKKVIRIN